jgi:hypothetical protein
VFHPAKMKPALTNVPVLVLRVVFAAVPIAVVSAGTTPPVFPFPSYEITLFHWAYNVIEFTKFADEPALYEVPVPFARVFQPAKVKPARVPLYDDERVNGFIAN